MDKQERETVRANLSVSWTGLNRRTTLRLLDALDAAEQRATLEAEQRSRWTRNVAALLGDFERRDQVHRSVDLDDASLLARAIELLRAMMPLGGQTSEAGADADR